MIDKNIKKIPLLRFKEFVGEWEDKRVKDLGSVRSGTTPLRSQSEYFINGSIPWVKTTDLNNSLVYTTEEKITTLALKETSLKLFPKGSILVAMYGGFNQIGRTGLLAIEATTNQALSVINTNRYVIPEYLLIWFNAKVSIWKKYASSSRKDPNITSSDVSNFPVFLPTIPEQQKIAAFLTAVDKKIALLNRKKALLEQYKKGVMQKLFSQEIRFKDDNGNDFPDWEEKRLGEVLSFIPTNSFSRNDLNYETGEIKNIHYGDIHTKFKMLFDLEKELVPFINNDLPIGKISQIQFCRAGDLIIADASEDYHDVGKTIEVHNTGGQKVVAGLHTLLARSEDDIIAKGFMGYLFQTWDIRLQIMKFAQGISVLGISKSNLLKVKFHLPTFKEQQKISGFLNCIDTYIYATERQITHTQKFKKGLLQQMFI